MPDREMVTKLKISCSGYDCCRHYLWVKDREITTLKEWKKILIADGWTFGVYKNEPNDYQHLFAALCPKCSGNKKPVETVRNPKQGSALYELGAAFKVHSYTDGQYDSVNGCDMED